MRGSLWQYLQDHYYLSVGALFQLQRKELSQSLININRIFNRKTLYQAVKMSAKQ